MCVCVCLCVCVCVCVCVYRMLHQNPDKSNNFLKQNVFNEKLNIIKKPFTLGIPVEHNYSIPH